MFPKLSGKQKAIEIRRIPLEGNRFTSINYRAQKEAMKKLGPNAFKVWVYLCGHKDKFNLALSSKVVTEFCNISRGTYDRAIQELIEKGYLTPAEVKKGLYGYNFWEGGAEQAESYRQEKF